MFHPAIKELAESAFVGLWEELQHALVWIVTGLNLPEWSAYGLLWLILGLFGAVMQHFIGGPSNPFGDKEEREAFWILLLAGPIACLIMMVTWYMLHPPWEEDCQKLYSSTDWTHFGR